MNLPLDAEDTLCRICSAQDEDRTLIHPCDCSGSLAGIHAECLETWIETRPGQGTVSRRQEHRTGVGLGIASNAEQGWQRLAGGNAGRVHESCLDYCCTNKFLAPDNDAKFVCEICHAPYRIMLEEKMDWSCRKFCTGASMGHFCELSLLTFVIGIMSFLWSVMGT